MTIPPIDIKFLFTPLPSQIRFFFESYNPDLNMSLLEEFTEEDICLPVVRGKIIGRVEKMQLFD